MNPESVSLNRERQALDHAQRLLDTGHPTKATKSLRRLSLRSPSLEPIGSPPKRSALGRGSKTPLQKHSRWLSLLNQERFKYAARYFALHCDDINRVLSALPNEVHEHTSPRPSYKPDRDDFIASYHYEMRKWKHEMQRRYVIKQYAKKLEDEGSPVSMLMLKTHIEKNKSVFDTPDPEEPVEPPALKEFVPPPISCDKTNALAAIDKRMAAERQKISKDDKPRPVMRHHVDANPWLYAKHARNK